MVSNQELFIYMILSFSLGVFWMGLINWYEKEWVLIEDWIETMVEKIRRRIKKDDEL